MTDTTDVPLTVHREGDPPPADLPSLAALYAEARARDLAVTLVAHPLTPDSKRHLAKRRHDVKAALRTFGFVLKAVEGGYRFDDDKAAAKIDAIAKALAVLEKECDTLCGVLHEE